MSIIETVIDIPMEHVQNVCGQFDAYLKKIERTLHVTMITRDVYKRQYSPSLITTATATIRNWSIKISIQAWAWSVWLL